MTDCSFTVSSKTASSIMMITDSFSASIVKNTVTLSKSAVTFKNVMSVLFQNIMIVTVCSKTVSSHIVMSIAVLNTQLDSSNAESAKNN